MSEKKRVGVFAVPFGFGPVSKAISVSTALSKFPDIELVLIGNGISLEYMKRENLTAEIIEIDPEQDTQELNTHLASQLDGAVVVLDFPRTNMIADKVPTFFVDSLGFMWDQSVVDHFPNTEKIARYYVQDLFGAHDQLSAKTTIPNLVPVQPILKLNRDTSSPQGCSVLHFGGLYNPISPETTQTYLEGMQGIIRRMKPQNALMLMSQTAIDQFPEILPEIEKRSLPHARALGAIAESEFTWSSPGLTAMLEMAHFDVATAPLPPQNYSQALNIRNMVRHYGDKLHPVWRFLDREYQEITDDMPEEEGVQKITELNARKLSDEGFCASFAALAMDASLSKSRLPEKLRSELNGADTIAQDIHSFFELT